MFFSRSGSGLAMRDMPAKEPVILLGFNGTFVRKLIFYYNMRNKFFMSQQWVLPEFRPVF
jgi:hypothetical protein